MVINDHPSNRALFLGQALITDYYEGLEKKKHPFELAATFHHDFEVIHPFTDGNGRVGREILNYMLKSSKFPKLLFLGKSREMYLNALKLGDSNHFREMVCVFADLILEQRKELFLKNLKNFVKPIKKKGQLKLTDFVNT